MKFQTGLGTPTAKADGISRLVRTHGRVPLAAAVEDS